jgi:ATP phosphoribosyltransferase regulatory subunit
MIHPIPSGTRDVLPDEMRELRAITEALRGAFEREGYGEIYTPAIEYE